METSEKKNCAMEGARLWKYNSFVGNGNTNLLKNPDNFEEK